MKDCWERAFGSNIGDDLATLLMDPASVLKLVACNPIDMRRVENHADQLPRLRIISIATTGNAFIFVGSEESASHLAECRIGEEIPSEGT